ncbi:hypothetical protein LSH36_335g02018 [Paralvinella palmiformis]|uniref:G-protein coupled receptors family 1 profile domain-containing protein n=1 Tax=Paralvinella palmiformis TaxID=53620 RepID=A0AAD9JFY4_9ANNE|nr:hypothetical protein LSH36_335g02018 [Paralvinella palmiformis]
MNLTNTTIWDTDILVSSTKNCSLVIPEDELNVMFQLVHGMVIPIIASVGILLNILNLIVLSNGRLKESSYTYLTGLAFADGAMLLLFFINGIGRGNFPKSSGWRFFEAYLYFPCGFATTTAGLLLTVIVSMERYIFIYKPMRARTWCTRRTARILTGLVWAFCVAVNLPRFFVFEVNTELGKLEYSEFGRSMMYIYMSWFHLLFMSCGCGLALIVLNILLIRGLHRTQNRRQALGARRTEHQRADDHRLTRTLISIVFLFLMGELPSALTSRALVVGLSGDPCVVETKAFKIMSLVSTILIVLQLSLNFVVYCVLNRRFWAVFKEQLCPCSRCRGGHHQDHPFINNNHHPQEEEEPMSITNHPHKSNVNETQENGLIN